MHVRSRRGPPAADLMVAHTVRRHATVAADLAVRAAARAAIASPRRAAGRTLATSLATISPRAVADRASARKSDHPHSGDKALANATVRGTMAID